MSLSELSIRRPVFATVLSLVIVLVGLMAYSRLSVREYPNIDEPTVSVQTQYDGASAEIIESQVTQPLEETLSGIEGLEVMTSSSRPEQSQITVKFKIARSAEGAAADVRDRVSQARAKLPDDVDEPIIRKVEADAQPIIYLALSSDRATQVQVTDIADRLVKDRLQNLPGVSEIKIFGERKPSMRIWLDRLRLAGYGLTPADVEDALRAQNIEIPAGRIESHQREFTILAETDLRTEQQFDNLIIRDAGGYLIRLKDVGHAELGPRDERVIARYMGNTAVAVGVVKQSTANPLEVSKAVRAAIPDIAETFPEGTRMDVGYDSSVFIERSIDNVFRAIGEAIGLVVIVIFVFLRSIRATFVPIVTIPVSLIGAFVFMWVLGFSINTLTLLALVLAVGLVVDDAIVMLENISRHVEEGMPPFEAALRGSREISFAVVAMTITLAAVYAPIAFQTGRTGRLFVEFALTLASSVIVSGFVALSLSPMMCSKLLRHEARHSWLYRVIEGGLNGLTAGYRRVLRFTLTVRAAVIVAMLAIGAFGIVLFTSLPSELSPVEDRGTIVVIGFSPEGSTPDYTFRWGQKIEQFLLNTPLIQKVFLVIGFNNDPTRAVGFSRMVDWSERDVKQQTVVQSLFPKIFGISGLMAFVMNPPSLGQSPVSKPIEFVLQTSQDYPYLQRAVDQLLGAARAYPGLVNVDTDLKLNKPQLSVDIDREKAASMGIEIGAIGRAVETMLGGRQVTRFKREGKQYDVVVQVKAEDRTTPNDLSQIYVRAPSSDAMVPLSNLVNIRETVAPKELNHFNKLRAAKITATLAPGYDQGASLAFLISEAKKLPPGIVYDFDGQSREFKASSQGLYVVFLLALAFIYLVLAAQFESWVDPFVIMLTVPLSIAGALLALKLAHQSLNVYSQIGLVTLVGLITKHGILIVEFSNQLRAAGRTIREAVVEAAVLRLRPILMTTGAMVLGSLPLAVATGAGGESRQAIGWVIVGGLVVGTFFTLFVIPSAYTLLARRHLPAHTQHAPEPVEAPPVPAE